MPILQMQKLHIRGLKYHFQSGPATEELCWLRVDQSRRSTSLRPSEDPTSSPSLMLQKRQQAWDVCSLRATVSSVPDGITRSSSPLSYGATPSRSGTVGLNPLLSTHSLLLPLPAAFCSLQTRDCTDLIPASEMISPHPEGCSPSPRAHVATYSGKPSTSLSTFCAPSWQKILHTVLQNPSPPLVLSQDFSKLQSLMETDCAHTALPQVPASQQQIIQGPCGYTVTTQIIRKSLLL
ncbi:uncharacterized protein LOC116579305 [Mustela erminea]|uniref:uncharacterized protein LOC116579305 n=1 Tax=Mustela erminea TaxID=36723 RepID=UPI001387261F|nr:uncharacterized protein LOC116579305 [Mustela erminea]